MSDFPEPASWSGSDDPTDSHGGSATSSMVTDGPQHIGQYQVMAPIGVGSSAAVYRGYDEASETEVAIKILADNYSLVTEIRQRFLEEAELLMSIRSPAVAQVYGQGETEGGQPYIVLELADRGTLGNRLEHLREEGFVPSGADLSLVADHLAEALSAIHRADIVHRDVAPGNILISAASVSFSDPSTDSPPALPSGRGREPGNVLNPGERYLLADLGFAKNLRQSSGLTAGGGTKGFAAPEQRGEVTVVDHRADIFGATAVIAWLAEGTDLVDAIGPFLETGLAEAPDDRHQSMADWLRDLNRRLDRRPASFATGPKTSAGGTAALPSVTDGGRRSRAPLVGLAAIGLGAVTAAAALFFTDGFDDGNVTESQNAESGEVTESQNAESAQVTNPDSSLESGPTTDAGPITSQSSTTVRSSTAAPLSTARPTTSTRLTTSTTPATSTASTSTTRPSSSTSTTARATTTMRLTTTAPVTTAGPTTTATPTTLDTTTTTDPIFRFSPRAYVESPTNGATIAGDLRIDGTAQYREGITGVLLTIRRIEDDFVWDPGAQAFVDQWLRFEVAVTPPEANDVTWTYTLSSSVLEPGSYMIRAWASGNGANDPVSDRIEVLLP